MASTRKKVAVIGAGPSGILALKCFKAEGCFELTCFEKAGHVGGLWKYHDDDVEGVASVMKTTIINSSKELTAVSDFPPSADSPNYMHHTLVYEYIQAIANKFDLLKYMKFYHETKKIEKADNYEETGRWKVTNENIQTGKLVTEVFDCVLICIGHHVYPNIPSFPNQEEFKGKIMHTHSLKNANGFEDQRVIVVGVGNSGMDAAVELSSVTKQVYLSSRRGTWIIPRVGPRGYPFDYVYIRRCLNILRDILPTRFINFFLELVINPNFNPSLYNLKPKHSFLNTHPTISDTLPIKLMSGAVKVCRGIKQFTKSGVIFEGDEHETEVDAVVLATGYETKFPFLSDDIVKVVNNRVQLYKHVFPPHLLHSTLAIIGLIQPFGGGTPGVELQARWTARIMSGNHKLPSKENMLKDIKKAEEINRKRFVQSPRHVIQVDYIEYQDELAEEIGVKPNLLKLAITDFKLFLALFFGTSLPYQYRLQGPHSWDGAREAILKSNERVKPYQKPIKHESFKQMQLLENPVLKIMFLLTLFCLAYLAMLIF